MKVRVLLKLFFVAFSTLLHCLLAAQTPKVRIKVKYFDPSNNEFSRQIWTFDTSGRILSELKMERQDTNRIVVQKIYSYNPAGRAIALIDSSVQDTSVLFSNYFYKQDTILEKIETRNEDKILVKEAFFYENRQKIVENYFRNDKLWTRRTLRFDTLGNQIENVLEDFSDFVPFTSKTYWSFYYEKGRLTKQLSYSAKQKDKPNSEKLFYYHANGLLLRTKEQSFKTKKKNSEKFRYEYF